MKNKKESPLENNLSLLQKKFAPLVWVKYHCARVRKCDWESGSQQFLTTVSS